MIAAESGADTLNRNLFLRQRFAFARQRFDRTIASLAYSDNGKRSRTESLRRASGAPPEETGAEKLNFQPLRPQQTAVKQRFGLSADADKLK